MFTLEKETKDHYFIKHKNGDVLGVAKKGLSGELHAHIKKMAHGGVANYADETDSVSENDAQPEEGQVLPGSQLMTNQPQSPPPVTINIHNGGAKGEETLPDQSQGQQISAQEPTELPMPKKQQGMMPQGMDFSGVPNYPQKLQGDIGLMQKGLQQQAQAQGNLGNQQAALYGQQAQAQQNFADLFQKNFNEESQNLKNVIDDYNNGHLDFNHIWQDKSTPKKILAGIGMLFSGIGSGMTGQPNMALKVINDEIERDMKQQLANQDKKKTAFSMYEKYYGNKEHAIAAQQLAQSAVVAAKANEMISKSAGPMAQAEMNQKMATLLQPMQEKLYNLSMERAKYQYMMGDGGINPQMNTGMQPANAVMPQEAPVGENTSVIPDLGRTGSVDLNKINGLEQLGWMPKEDKEAATKEAKDFQESQTTKSLLLKDLTDMSSSVTENKTHGFLDPLGSRKGQEMISKLPFEMGKVFSEMEPWGGELSRKYAAAKSSALNKINTLLTKRIGGEAMKNIELQVPDRSDSPEEMRNKIQRIMTLIDANTATPTLDRYKLIRR